MSDKQNKQLVYMDHSATTPVDKRVADVVYETMLRHWGNPSSKYTRGGEAKVILEQARERVAEMLHATPAEVYFMSGGTEADNLALYGVMYRAREKGVSETLVTTAFEHSAVLKTAEFLKKEGFHVVFLPIDKGGFVDLDVLEHELKKGVSLVSVMHVNNEIGTIQPIETIGRLCQDYGSLFHTDAVQSFGKLPIDAGSVHADLLSCSSHKIYGPKGVGALFVRKGLNLRSFARGGGQEKGVRTGTENMPGIAGFGEAVQLCFEEMKTENDRLGKLRDRLWSGLQEKIEGEVLLNGSMENRLGANLNIAFPGLEGESLLMSLDMDGIAVSTGSACSSGSDKPSHVLLALGLDERTAQSSLRLTLGRSTTEEDIAYVIEKLSGHVNRFRAMAF
ncbi:aminotransferase class V-fold PLP-dependent enzyme [bacterium]|nr:aminotransferase class V-fold PLP-dependent enzyme [bacterium]